MDPFSLTVGAFTLVGVVASTGKTLKKLVSLKKAPQELLQLINEISDFQLTIAKSDEIIESLAANHPLSSSLQDLKKRAESPVKRLQHLLEDHIIENYSDLDLQKHHEIEFSIRSWAKRQDEARRLKLQIKEVQSMIEHVLVLNSAYILPQFQSRLTEIAVENRQMHTSIRQLAAQLRGEEATSTSNSSPTHSNTNAHPVRNFDGDLEPGQDVALARPRLPTALQHAEDAVVDSEVLQLATELSASRRCSGPLCICRCHTVKQINPVPWASTLVGSLFIGYSGLPLPLMPKVVCNQKGCQKNERRLIKVAWYFPSWFPKAWDMISIISKWTPLEGHDLSIKLPRIVPSSADIFLLAQKGSIDGIQQLITQKQASVYDVSVGEGRTALHFALTADQPEVAAFLIRQNANVSFEDHNALSPIDLVWNYTLESPTKPVYVAFKKVFQAVIDESEDLQRRNFTPLHLIVFGLSSVSLEALLELSTAEINTRCSLGRTALCWAALREDPQPVRVLVSKGASLSLADNRGQNAFHFAAETGSIESLRTLLEAAQKTPADEIPTRNKTLTNDFNFESNEGLGSDVSLFCKYMIETKDYKGRTSLHFATRTDQFEHAQLLLWYGADVDSPDSVLNRTPLLLAIYWNRHRIVKLFLDAGARTDIADDRRMTALHYAARFGDAETLAVLGGFGTWTISADVKDVNGLTPLDTFEQMREGVLRETEQALMLSRQRFESILAKCKKPDVDEDG